MRVAPPPPRMTIRAQLLWLVLPLALLPIAILVASRVRLQQEMQTSLQWIESSIDRLRFDAGETQRRLHEDLQEQVTDQMHADAVALARSIEERLSGYESILLATARDEYLPALFGDGGRDRLEARRNILAPRLGRLMEELGLHEVRVLDGTGRELIREAVDQMVDFEGFSDVLRNAREDESGSSWFKQLVAACAAGQRSFATIYQNEDFAPDAEHPAYLGLRPSLLLATGLRLDDSGRFDPESGQVRGYLAFTIDLQPELERMALQLFEGWVGSLFDRAGRQITLGQPSMVAPLPSNVPHVEYVVRGPGDEPVCTVRLSLWPEKFERMLKRMRTLSGAVADRTAEVAEGFQIVEEGLEDAGRGQLLFGLLIAVVAAGAALWISNRASLRIRHLTQAAERMAEGGGTDLAMKLARGVEQEQDEIGFLAGRFCQMAEALAERDREIQRYVLQMERLVAERTHELTEQTQSLEAVVAEAQLRRIEAERANEVARAASKAKSEFLANTSHEIRTPMNGILGLLQLIEARPLDEETRRLTRDACECAESLLAILNDILDFSKIEAGKLELECIPFDPRRLFEGPVALVLAEGREKGLQATVHVSDNMPSALMGDFVRLRQILMNLLSNAIKFTLKGSVKVLVSAEPCGGDGVRLWVEVRDTGVGIRRDRQAAIWGSFAQEDGSTTRRFGGSGLGLAICRRLVDLMGGEISLQSVVGEGSSFWFVVPLKMVAPADADAPVRQGQAKEQVLVDVAPTDLTVPVGEALAMHRRVLLVEDNAVNRKVATKMLERIGCQVTTAEDGRKAVQEAAGAEFELILMDLQMPLMDGLSATRAIRKAEAEVRRTPIVALTANAMEQDRRQCEEAGMDGFLAKPYRAQDLLATVNRWLVPKPVVKES